MMPILQSEPRKNYVIDLEIRNVSLDNLNAEFVKFVTALALLEAEVCGGVSETNKTLEVETNEKT